MLNKISSAGIVGVLWVVTVAAGVAGSVAMRANLSTSALLLGLGLAPVVVALRMRSGSPPPTVAELLYAVNNEKESRP